MGGIYIKGMEMPVQCVSCPLWRVMVLRSPALDICGATHRQIYKPYSSRPEWCPLVEVPAHGRLIDGDELSEGCDEPYWCRWKSEIDEAPTIIPAEEDDNENHA